MIFTPRLSPAVSISEGGWRGPSEGSVSLAPLRKTLRRQDGDPRRIPVTRGEGQGLGAHPAFNPTALANKGRSW